MFISGGKDVIILVSLSVLCSLKVITNGNKILIGTNVYLKKSFNNVTLKLWSLCVCI